MKWLEISAERVIDAEAAELYQIVADYKVGHPAILPKPYFTELVVESGGYGAGTVIRGNVRIWGQDYPFRHEVSEPEPGRVLQETDVDTGQINRFLFEPLNNGTQTRVTIASQYPPTPGLMGWLEPWIKPRIVRGIYQQELAQLAAYVQQQRSQERQPQPVA
jgi:hypothetical protein